LNTSKVESCGRCLRNQQTEARIALVNYIGVRLGRWGARTVATQQQTRRCDHEFDPVGSEQWARFVCLSQRCADGSCRRSGQQPGFVQREAPAQGGGFLSGALQTAAGVAGGMVLGNMLMGMFQDDGADQLASQAPAEEPPVAQEEPVSDDHYADEGFFGGGDDEEFV